jgi:transcriptional adapter 2-alpha
MPKRGDFSYEYEQEIEALLMDHEFQFESDDNEEETRFLKETVEFFNLRLDERIKRKRLVIDRGVLDPYVARRPISQGSGPSRLAEKKRTKEERDITNALKVFVRFS